VAADWREDFPAFGESWTLVAAVDRAMALRESSDRTVAVLLGRALEAREPRPVVLFGLRVFPVGHSGADILSTLRGWQARFGRFSATALESYQAVDPHGQARDLAPSLVHATVPQQQAAFSAAARLLQEGLLVLPEVGAEYLADELLHLRASIRRDMSLRFEAPRGRRDDAAFAFSLAAAALAGCGEATEPAFSVYDYVGDPESVFGEADAWDELGWRPDPAPW
jgi:hypothetical protein